MWVLCKTILVQVEVLFEEILKNFAEANDADVSSHVRAVIRNSPYKHMATSMGRKG